MGFDFVRKLVGLFVDRDVPARVDIYTTGTRLVAKLIRTSTMADPIGSRLHLDGESAPDVRCHFRSGRGWISRGKWKHKRLIPDMIVDTKDFCF